MSDQPNPQDIADILNHKRFVWMLKRHRTKTHIQHYSKGEWGEIRWDWGFVCGAVFTAPFWLLILTIIGGR